MPESTAAPFCIRLFGPFEICLNGTPLPRPRLRKGQWVVALLTLRQNAALDRSWLAGALWPDSSEVKALRGLRQCLNDLRQVFGPEAARLRAPTARTLAFDLAGAAVDVIDFDAAIACGDGPSLEHAVALYRGPLLAECAEEWVFPERQQREDAYLGALETLAAQALAGEDAPAAVDHLRRVVAADPLRERAHRSLMQALAAGGNVAAATEVYRDLRLLLHREINAAPDPETTALYQQIRAGARQKAGARGRGPGASKVKGSGPDAVDPVSDGTAPRPLTPDPASSLPTAAPRSPNLPVQRTLLVGREKEIAGACELLRRAEVGLATLTGPAGAGKTRLGLRVAAEMRGEFADGVFFVSLAPVSDPERVLPAIALALGVQETAGQALEESLTEHLQEKQLLLLLDNFEQVLPAAPRLAGLLAAAPRLKLLVTSRSALRLREEREFPVPLLPVPEGGVGCRVWGVGSADEGTPAGPYTLHPTPDALLQYPSVQLFLDRARAVKPDLTMTPENAPAVAAICAHLAGLPLAIELAAAWIKLLPPQALLARLVGSDLASAADGPPHRSSLQLLTGGARDLPARHQSLREAIAWSYDLLDEGEKALFRRLSVFSAGCTLAAAKAVSGAVGCQPSAVSEEGPALTDGRQPTADSLEALDRLASLIDKSLLLQEERAGGEPRFMMLETIREYGQECLGASGEADAVRNQHADFFLAWTDRTGDVSQLESEHDNLRAALAWLREHGEIERAFRLAMAVWWLWYLRGHLTEGREQMAALLAMEPDRRSPACLSPARAMLLRRAGQLAGLQGDYRAARSLLEESLALFRELGDSEKLPATLNALGEVARTQGDHKTARTLFEESLALLRAERDEVCIAWALQGLGEVAREQGDADARALLAESLALFREVGDARGIAFALGDLGEEARARGDLPAAQALLEESLEIGREMGHKGSLARTLRYLGALAADQAKYDAAHSLLAECLSLRRELGDKRSAAVCLEQLAEVAISRACEPRQTSDPVQRMAKARNALAGPGLGFASPLPDFQRAAELLGASQALRRSIGAPLQPAERDGYERCLAVARAALGEADFTAAWRTGQGLSLDQAIRTVEARC